MTNWKHTEHLREMAWLSVRGWKQVFVPWQELLKLAVVHYCMVLNWTYSVQIFLYPALSCLTSWWLDQSSKGITCIKKEKSNTFRTVIVPSLEVLKFVLQQINKNVCVTVSNGRFYWQEALANYIHINRHVIPIKNKIKQNLLCLTDTHTINILYVIVLFYVFI